ncbi:MAG TPA: ABC transporter permease [Oscillospiraceae bacterium]|nr:ABC transporter permease [Oscillospiraceae bacterium]
MSLLAFLGSVELGLIYAVMTLGVFISFRTLNTPDLTVDGSFVLGAAVAAVLCSGGGNPLLAILAAFAAGCAAGAVTALLNTKLQIQPLLSGILVMLALYSVNLRVMGGRANIHLMNAPSIYRLLPKTALNGYSKLATAALALLITLLLLYFFLKTRLGFALRATGDNEVMVRAAGIDSNQMKLFGLSLANGLVAASGAMIAQYQSYADVGMGIGMVVIGLASVIIGEVIFGVRPLFRRLIAVVLGSILYRLIIAFALGRGMPATDLKLVSAIIVTIALSTGILKESFAKRVKHLPYFQKRVFHHD